MWLLKEEVISDSVLVIWLYFSVSDRLSGFVRYGEICAYGAVCCGSVYRDGVACRSSILW